MGKRPVCLACLLLIAVICSAKWLGGSVIQRNPLDPSLQAWVEKQSELTICGEVERCEDTEKSQSVYLKNTYLVYHSKKVSIENVRIFLKESEELPAGSVVLVSGKLEQVEEARNPGEFNGRQYYACRHIWYVMKKAVIERKSESYDRYGQFLADIRERACLILEQTASDKSAVFQAIVLGDKTGLEPELKLQYQMAGIIHILAISGLHISILGVGFYELLKKTGFGIWPAGIVSFVFMLQYGMVTGGSVSTMRAVIMFLISVGAKMLGRIYDMPTALGAAAIVILVQSPDYLLDGGFWLSFGAVAGIGAVSPAFLGMFCPKIRLLNAFLSSVAVWFATLPIMLWFYGEASVAGVFLNLLVLPTVGIVLASGIGAVIGGAINLKLGAAAAFPGRLLLAFYEKLCASAGRLPFCTWIAGKPKGWQIVVYYLALLLIITVFRWADRNKWEGKKRRVVCVGGILLLVLSAAVAGWRSRSNMTITCLDVGQGDSIVVETPERHFFVIDGGSANKTSVGQYQILPYLKQQGISRLDAILVSHTDEDHISGVRQILEYMAKGLTSVKADCLILPKWQNRPEVYQELVSLAYQAKVRVLQGKEGDKMQYGKLGIEIISPEKSASGENVNEEGLVFYMEYGQFRGLFTGDTGFETEEKLTDKLKDITFLKVGHHGSKNSTGEEFLKKIMPETGVISVSSTNTYGHPSQDTLTRLKNAGCRYWCTMDKGAVTVETDGKCVKVDTFLR